MITEAQYKTLQRLEDMIFKSDSHAAYRRNEATHLELSQDSKYEFKDFKTEVVFSYTGGRPLAVMLITTMGMKDDEGSMASVLCRQTRIIMVGKRGGCKLLNAKRKTQSKGLFNCAHGLTSF